MGWKVLAGAGAALLATVGGVWWAVAASAVPPGPVIGPALVVTPRTAGQPTSSPTRTVGQPDPSDSAPIPSFSSPSASRSRATAAPETVDPEWARPVESDDDQHDEGDD
ncbi:hypothetical protein [Paractinoplanes durhamensis]|uniref:Uncharacterized protein n=1 Tax=Paractinoplanes durhamensis TaxID=113563 RepID=A0ABQ3ZD52_9ACTN|nr:hypothetical protein [Actinoplanes durhamensis]GIE07773.1 hypothetical protein Adu01nite_91230 [Actinoplanes durhamensis]